LSSRLLSKYLNIKTYKTIILPAVLYGCETWSLALREEQRFRVLENKVLRIIFGPNKGKVAGGWRKTAHRSSITCTHHKYYYSDQIKEDEMREMCTTLQRNEKCLQNIGRKT
jgi:hypothetical protein